MQLPRYSPRTKTVNTNSSRSPMSLTKESKSQSISQSFQTPFIKEYTLNYEKDPVGFKDSSLAFGSSGSPDSGSWSQDTSRVH